MMQNGHGWSFNKSIAPTSFWKISWYLNFCDINKIGEHTFECLYIPIFWEIFHVNSRKTSKSAGWMSSIIGQLLLKSITLVVLVRGGRGFEFSRFLTDKYINWRHSMSLKHSESIAQPSKDYLFSFQWSY